MQRNFNHYSYCSIFNFVNKQLGQPPPCATEGPDLSHQGQAPPKPVVPATKANDGCALTITKDMSTYSIAVATIVNVTSSVASVFRKEQKPDQDEHDEEEEPKKERARAQSLPPVFRRGQLTEMEKTVASMHTLV